MSAIWSRIIMNQVVQEPFQFAMSISTDDSNDVDELIQSCGLVVLEHLKDTNEMTRRYLPNKTGVVVVVVVGDRPNNTIGIIGDYGGFVVAGIPSDSVRSHQ